MAKIKKKDLERVIPDYSSLTADNIPATTMSRHLAEQWEAAKLKIRAVEGEQTFNGFFRDMRFYGRQGINLVFSNQTPFTAGRIALWLRAILERNISREMQIGPSCVLILVDDRMRETPAERMMWVKRYFARWLAEQPPVQSWHEPEAPASGSGMM